jgi:hypothetical protein
MIGRYFPGPAGQGDPSGRGSFQPVDTRHFGTLVTFSTLDAIVTHRLDRGLAIITPTKRRESDII